MATCEVDEPADIAVTLVDGIETVLDDLRRGRLAAVGIDMPIGLPESGRRRADDAARALLGPRRSSLFTTPPRAVLASTDFDDAQAISRRASGHGMSIQAYHLLPKIREVAAGVTPDLQPRLAEVHPETSFAVLGGAPCVHPKRLAAGQAERLDLLRLAFGRFFDEALVTSMSTTGANARRDDIADALVAAWTARRIALGTATVLGDPAERDGLGFALTITA